MKLYVEIGLTHTEFIPKKRLIDPPRLLPDVSKMSARYAGFESMSQTEIDKLCNRLSQPKKRQECEISNQGNTKTEHKIHDREHTNNWTSTRFLGSKRMSSNAIQSLVDRLSNTSSARSRTFVKQEDSKEGKSMERSVVSSYAWTWGIRKYQRCSNVQHQKHCANSRRNV